MTIPIDDYMNGYDIYEAYISDHKPVLLSFNMNLKKWNLIIKLFHV